MLEDLTNNKISVVIRTRNEEQYIGFAIQSVLDTFDNPEIIIVDNHSNDETINIIKEFCFSDIKVYSMQDYSPGKSLNFGVSKCTNDIVLILSAHCEIIDKVDLKEIKWLLEEKKYVAVFGKQIPIYRGRKISRRYIWSNFKDESEIDMVSENEKRRFLHNAFCFYSKDALLKYPFNEQVVGKEDRVWASLMVDTVKSHYLYCPKYVCKHHWTPNGNTWKGIS